MLQLNDYTSSMGDIRDEINSLERRINEEYIIIPGETYKTKHYLNVKSILINSLIRGNNKEE